MSNNTKEQAMKLIEMIKDDTFFNGQIGEIEKEAFELCEGRGDREHDCHQHGFAMGFMICLKMEHGITSPDLVKLEAGTYFAETSITSTGFKAPGEGGKG